MSQTLDGWKPIAAYLRRDVRTAMRWAAERGLPVRRAMGARRGSVSATTDELDRWVDAQRSQLAAVAPVLQTAPVQELTATAWWHRKWLAGAITAGAAALLAIVALSRFGSDTATAAVAPDFKDPTTKAMFLQASYDWNLRTSDSLSRAVHEFGDTIARDPRVPAAYSGLANSYLLLREYGSLPDAEAYGRAEAAAKAAIALAPDSLEAHRALAFIAFWWRQDRAAAGREFRQALVLNPGDPLTHHWLANALLANGQPDAALREIDRARELDPTASSIVADRAAILYYAGRKTEGLAALRALATEQPNDVGPHRSLAEIALAEGRGDEFLREATITAHLRGDQPALAAIRSWRANGSTMHALVAAMLRDAQGGEHDWFQIAKLLALTEQHEPAARALARACSAHEAAAVSAFSNPWLARSLSRDEIARQCGPATPLI